jgi:DNA mismatch repair protein MutS2
LPLAICVPLPKAKRVEKVTNRPYQKICANFNSHTSDIASFSPEIDVRGMRTEDALHAIEKLFDRALMMGFNNLKIFMVKAMVFYVK